MEDSLPTKFITSVKPKKYLTQGISHCGAYSVKGILSAYGFDDKIHPKEYHSNWFGRLTGLTFGTKYLVNILKSNGIDAKKGNAKGLSVQKKLDLLKILLAKNRPLMIRIGNGYYHSDKYNPVLGKIIGHWITLWGYDDDRQIFYVYDSGLLRKHWNKTIPIGNTIRTYNEIIRDWNFGNLQFWYWLFTSPETYTYIAIKK